MTKKHILEASAQVFAEKGYHASSMEDIAKVVGLKKASLYHHVESKQEILVELLDQSLDLLIDRVKEVIEKDLPQDQKFKLAMGTYMSSLVEYRELSSVLLFEHRSLGEEALKRHVPRRDKLESLMRGIIEDGVSEGVFFSTDPSISVDHVVPKRWFIERRGDLDYDLKFTVKRFVSKRIMQDNMQNQTCWQ
jgi:AcrR family transcriptional regulator